MAENQVGQEIRAGFAAVGGAFKEAGRRRNMELVAKQGYVGFKNPDAVAAFHSNPEYVDWICKFVDGEYRFYPPENMEVQKVVDNKITEQKVVHLETREVVETYKAALAEKDKTSFVSVKVEDGLCHYKLVTSDKKTGNQNIVQDFYMEFDGQFSKEIIPSVYNQLMGGFPVVDVVKGEENRRTIAFQSIDASRQMVFSNLNEAQLELIRNMKKFVDSQYFDIDTLEKKESSGRKI